MENLCTAGAVSSSVDYEFIAYYIAQLLYSYFLLAPETIFVVGGELFEQNQQ